VKKLINDPADVVADALRGIAAAHGDRVRVDHEHRIVFRRDAPRPGKVGLVSGWRLRSRADARWLRRAGHAGRRLRR
jgi:hypothetical protein